MLTATSKYLSVQIDNKREGKMKELRNKPAPQFDQSFSPLQTGLEPGQSVTAVFCGDRWPLS